MTTTGLPKPDYENILHYFPLDTFRNEQEEILLKFKEYLLDPEVDYIICQAATGTGKSALALAAALASKSAYVATANKVLQDQYTRDFSDVMVNLKGRANYECWEHPGATCGNSPCRKTPESRSVCAGNNACEYHKERDRAAASAITAFNFAAALPYLNYLGHLFPPRNLLVCDEAHSVWSWITNFIGVDLNLKLLQEINVLDFIPNYDQVEQYLDLVGRVQSTVEEYLKLDGIDAALVEKLEGLQNRLKVFDIITDNKTNTDNFILDKTFDLRDYTKITNLSFKPVEVSELLHDYFFKYAQKTVLLSAVILDFDTYMQLMGIDPARARIISIDSTFPVENKPFITYEAVGRLNKGNLDAYLPDLCYKIIELMDKYAGVKGIIHGVSWYLCSKLYNGFPERIKDRVLFAAAGDTIANQTDLIQEHTEAKEPTVLLSPSMAEGIDLHYDLSRLQIIVKIPYPYLGDPLVRRRMELYPNFYPMKTAETLVQMYGRSIRSATDTCDTYILDAGFLRFLENNFEIFPKSFISSIVRLEPR